MVFLVGLALMVGPWWFLPWDPGAPGVFLLVLRVLPTAAGGAFCGLGLAVGWSRLGAEVDREAGRLVLLRRVAFYTARQALPLDDLHSVRLVAAGPPGGDTPAYLEFRLRGRGRLTFGFPATADRLRTLLGWLRDHLDLPAEAFAGAEAGAPPLSPDEEEAAAAFARLSASRVIRARWNPGGMSLEFPPTGWRGIALGMAAAALASAALVGFLGWKILQQTPPPPTWVPFLFGLIPLVFLLVAVHLARKSLRINVSGGVLRVDQGGLFRRRRAFLRDQVVDLVVFTPPHGRGERPQTVLTLLAKGRHPLLRLTHPALDRHPEEWKAVAEALRHYLARG